MEITHLNHKLDSDVCNLGARPLRTLMIIDAMTLLPLTFVRLSQAMQS